MSGAAYCATTPTWRTLTDMTEEPELLKPRDAAKLAGVLTDTLADWVRAGKLEAVFTAGGHRRYRRTDITAITVGGPK